ncbi:PIN domain-containing protein [Dyadobacter sp. CY312]|uniref:PIN domain-containing protein n=1 Tax=Dyadobacter sp. CY312 TaxID=2907303 RepID=UPI00286D77FE|nr:PIN domain-containing protein [Dyadobacter sp. CY312]
MKPMKDRKCFLDTNILLYCYAQDEPLKQSLALEAASNNYTFISTQVVKETCNILRKKAKLSWENINLVVDEIESNNEIVQVKISTIRSALHLVNRFKLQWFDSIIIASALEANCSVLYSEDLQDGFKIDNLVIENPFKALV